MQLCEPLSSERAWLAERHARFEELLIDCSDTPPGAASGLVGVARRPAARAALGRPAASCRGREFARRQPRLADAGLRWLHSVGEPPPPDAPRGERSRAPLSIDDWIVLLGRLRAALPARRPERRAVRPPRLDALQIALRRPRLHADPRGHPAHRRRGRPRAAHSARQADRDVRPARRRVRVARRRRCAPWCCATPSARRGSRTTRRSTLSGGGRGLLRRAVGRRRGSAAVRPALVTASTFAVAPRRRRVVARRCSAAPTGSRRAARRRRRRRAARRVGLARAGSARPPTLLARRRDASCSSARAGCSARAGTARR